MTESPAEPLLTPEELSAILSEAAEGRLEAGRSAGLAEPFRPGRAARASRPPNPAPQLRQCVEDVAAAWGKDLASSHQRRIECSLLSWQEMETAELLEMMLPGDRATLFELGGSGTRGLLLVARPLAFGLLCLSFGARRISELPPPDRDYTRIERRFLRKVSTELLERIEHTWSGWCPARIRLGDLCGPGDLRPALPESLLVASLDVLGLSPVGRLRIAFPASAFRVASGDPVPASRPSSRALEPAVTQLEVGVKAEIGSTRITLAALGALQPGDELPLTPSAPGGLLVRVEGRPKFRASQGSVAGRLAVQVTERLESGGGA